MKTIPNTNSELQNRPEQSSTTKTGLSKINFYQRHRNRSLDTQTLLAVLRGDSPCFFELAEVVGRWVWIQFKQPPTAEIRRQLAQLGFHWNRTRQSWQHPCGLYRDQLATFDPRRKYGSYFAADTQPA